MVSQYQMVDKTGRKWIVGYDNLRQGYFAFRKKEDLCEPETWESCDKCTRSSKCPNTGGDFDIEIGAGRGVSIITLDLMCQIHWLYLTGGELFMLEEDWRQEIETKRRKSESIHRLA